MKILFVFLAPLPLLCNPQGADVLAGSAAFHTPSRTPAANRSVGSGHHRLGFVLDRRRGDHPFSAARTSILRPQPRLRRRSKRHPRQLCMRTDRSISSTRTDSSSAKMRSSTRPPSSPALSIFSMRNFWQGNDLHFSGDSKASLINCGTILAKDGSAILIGYLDR